MTQYGVLVEGNAYRVYATEDGITKRPFGPRFGGPFLAGQYADLSAGRPISPLRRRAEGIPDSAGVWGTASGDKAALGGSPAVAIPPAIDRA